MFDFSEYEYKLNEMEKNLRQVDIDIMYFKGKTYELERILKSLLAHLELKEVEVKAFTQLISTKPCGGPEPCGK